MLRVRAPRFPHPTSVAKETADIFHPNPNPNPNRVRASRASTVSCRRNLTQACMKVAETGDDQEDVPLPGGKPGVGQGADSHGGRDEGKCFSFFVEDSLPG